MKSCTTVKGGREGGRGGRERERERDRDRERQRGLFPVISGNDPAEWNGMQISKR